jgi:hypothetical protein
VVGLVGQHGVPARSGAQAAHGRADPVVGERGDCTADPTDAAGSRLWRYPAERAAEKPQAGVAS